MLKKKKRAGVMPPNAPQRLICVLSRYETNTCGRSCNPTDLNGSSVYYNDTKNDAPELMRPTGMNGQCIHSYEIQSSFKRMNYYDNELNPFLPSNPPNLKIDHFNTGVVFRKMD